MTRPHELFAFMQEVTDEMAAEYARISERVGEDPGTAGDAGEENWADLMRRWLPPAFHVETKGRVLSHNGQASPQLDVLILHPAYPETLRRKKLYMSTGVVAVLECKLTLRRPHIQNAFETAAALHHLTLKRVGNPHDELHHPIAYGLVAHSHTWTQPRATPTLNVETALEDAHQGIAQRPCDIPDFVCIADLGTWTSTKLSSTALLMQTPEAQALGPAALQAAGAMPHTQYMRPAQFDGGGVTPTPIAAMFSRLLMRLGFEHELVKPVSDYFRLTGLLGSAESFSNRTWPPDNYSDEIRSKIPGRLVNDGSSKWGMAFI